MAMHIEQFANAECFTVMTNMRPQACAATRLQNGDVFKEQSHRYSTWAGINMVSKILAETSKKLKT